jgi:hypothetical protein
LKTNFLAKIESCTKFRQRFVSLRVEATIWALLGQQQARTTTLGVYSSKSRSWSWRLHTSRNFQQRKVSNKYSTSGVYSSKSRSWSWRLHTSRNFQQRKVRKFRSMEQKNTILKLKIVYPKNLPVKHGKDRVIYQ